MEAVKGMMGLAKFKSDVISWKWRTLAKFKSDVSIPERYGEIEKWYDFLSSMHFGYKFVGLL